MYICASCGSPNVISNKLDVAPFDRASGGAAHLRASGQPAAALGVLALWGMTHVVNAFSHAHRCADCGHLFSVSRRDWFDEVFGGAAADARSKLIDEAWFGRKVGQASGGSEHEPEWDPVLDAKLNPDRVLDEKLFDLAMQRAGTRAIEDERLKNPEPPDFDLGR